MGETAAAAVTSAARMAYRPGTGDIQTAHATPRGNPALFTPRPSA